MIFAFDLRGSLYIKVDNHEMWVSVEAFESIRLKLSREIAVKMSSWDKKRENQLNMVIN